MFFNWDGAHRDFLRLAKAAFALRDDKADIAEDFLGILLDEVNVNENDAMLKLRVNILLPHVNRKIIVRTLRKLLTGDYGDENNVVAFTNALHEYLTESK